MLMSSPENLQSIVCEIIREYLQKKPFFSIEDIVTFINNRVRANPNLNRNRIELIIKDLIRKRILVPGTKLMKNNIIEHPIRNEIYNYIKKHPSNINEIMKAINIGSNQALWHLSCLEKFRFTRSKKMDNQRIIFTYESNPKFDKHIFYLKHDIIREIINFMEKEDKKFKITEIATGLKKNYNSIKKYLKVLLDLELVKIEKDKKSNVFKLDKEKYSDVQSSINRM